MRKSLKFFVFSIILAVIAFAASNYVSSALGFIEAPNNWDVIYYTLFVAFSFALGGASSLISFSIRPRGLLKLVVWSAAVIAGWLFVRFILGLDVTFGWPYLAVLFAVQLLALIVARLLFYFRAHFSDAFRTLAVLAASAFLIYFYQTPFEFSTVWQTYGGSEFVIPVSFLIIGILVTLILAKRNIASWSNPVSRLKNELVWVAAIIVGWVAVCIIAGATPALHRGSIVLVGLILGLVGIVPPAILAIRSMINSSRAMPVGLAKNDETRSKLTRGTHRSQKTAWVISYTGVSNEPRVLRQCHALMEEGWEVVVCGMDGHSERPKEWFFINLPSSDALSGPHYRILAILRGLGEKGLAIKALSPFHRQLALMVQRCQPLWNFYKHELIRVGDANKDIQPEFVIAHDWFTADVGYALAKRYGAKFSIDCHEYAPGQYMENPEWVREIKPYVDNVHNHYLEKADLVTTVCQGIADHLNAENKLKRPVLVVRSLPFSQPQKFRATGKSIEVLYHGDISERREIHTALESMPLWNKNLTLRLRGNGDADYMQRLKSIIAANGLEKRVTFEAPVPFDKIIPSANKSDIGFFSFLDLSPQVRFTFPNKFFEYIMAGLAICVTDLPEVARIVNQYENGKLIGSHKKELIAEVLNSFTVEEIDTFKKASVKAAKELNWDNEKRVMLDGYAELRPWF